MISILGLEIIARAQADITFWQVVCLLAVVGFFWCIGRWLRDGR